MRKVDGIALALLAALSLAACESPRPQRCRIETPRQVALSTSPLVTRQVYTTPRVEIAMTQETFLEMREAVCQRSEFFEGCADLVTLEANPAAEPSRERLRERVVRLMLAAALDLGRVTVTERRSGELVPVIVAESFEDTCSSRHRIGRRYSLPGASPFLEVRDL